MALSALDLGRFLGVLTPGSLAIGALALIPWSLVNVFIVFYSPLIDVLIDVLIHSEIVSYSDSFMH